MLEGIKTKATIVDYVQEVSKDKKITYYLPVIEFKNKYGIKVTKKLDSGISSKHKSKDLEIIYIQKDDEYEILINDSIWRLYFPLGFSILGGFFLVIAVLRTVLIYQ